MRGKLPDPIPLTPGEDPTPEHLRYNNLPCSCGELHENAGKTWEMDWLKLADNMVTGEEIKGRYRRCKKCKDWLMVARKQYNGREKQ